MSLRDLTLAEARDKLAAREVSAAELTDAYITVPGQAQP